MNTDFFHVIINIIFNNKSFIDRRFHKHIPIRCLGDLYSLPLNAMGMRSLRVNNDLLVAIYDTEIGLKIYKNKNEPYFLSCGEEYIDSIISLIPTLEAITKSCDFSYEQSYQHQKRVMVDHHTLYETRYVSIQDDEFDKFKKMIEKFGGTVHE